MLYVLIARTFSSCESLASLPLSLHFSSAASIPLFLEVLYDVFLALPHVHWDTVVISNLRKQWPLFIWMSHAYIRAGLRRKLACTPRPWPRSSCHPFHRWREPALLELLSSCWQTVLSLLAMQTCDISYIHMHDATLWQWYTYDMHYDSVI